MEDIQKQLTEAWRTNNRINLFLIDKISAAGMKCTLSARGGRNVVRQFCHLHNVRIYQMENRAKDLAAGLRKFESKEEPDKKTLKAAFDASGKAVETFLADCLAGKPKRRIFKKGIFATLGYFINHEGHHRGSILLTLKQNGHGLDKDAQYAIWNWDKI